MNYVIVENGINKYIEFISAAFPLNTEQDALDLVALCGEKPRLLFLSNLLLKVN
ncbi:MAG: hypothetical protein A4E52_01049 [Pelotomaculum sp. PtaB.Bin013]|nr:MAG: hypothetical protein A4E52_01049 [Pelotomaculum sp. PtaB.Bin013]